FKHAAPAETWNRSASLWLLPILKEVIEILFQGLIKNSSISNSRLVYSIGSNVSVGLHAIILEPKWLQIATKPGLDSDDGSSTMSRALKRGYHQQNSALGNTGIHIVIKP
ncbi:hypothetical protein A2U01_0015135, partial [Trifolium medium]|nr:hypothetical protein [Trifolium medium]